MKVMILIRSLGLGGSERQVVEIARGLHRRGHDVTVVTFYSGGALEQDLADAGVPARTLAKKGRWDVTGFLLRFLRAVRDIRPEVLYTVLPTENLVGLVAKMRFRSIKAVWGVRSAYMELQHYDFLTRQVYRLEALLARFADLIVANSHAGAASAISRGFPPGKIQVVCNAVNCATFAPHARRRAQVRSEWGIPDGTYAVGVVSRLDPLKDHESFLSAAAAVAKRRTDVRFILVGEGPRAYADALAERGRQLGIGDRLSMIGAQRDMPGVYNALDLAVLSSASEGFPNVVAEAMACGVPCAVTDVGDARTIVGQTGWVVPARNSAELAAVIEVGINSLTPERKTAARSRILENFGSDRALDQIESIFHRVAESRPATTQTTPEQPEAGSNRRRF